MKTINLKNHRSEKDAREDLLNECLKARRAGYTMEIIHGHGGDAKIKKMVKGLSDLVDPTGNSGYSRPYNPGVTILKPTCTIADLNALIHQAKMRKWYREPNRRPRNRY